MIKKKMLLISIFVICVSVMTVFTVTANAEEAFPYTEATPPPNLDRADGPLQKYVVSAMAEILGMKTEDLQKRINAGEGLWDIAKSAGVSADEFRKKMDEAFSKAIEAALKDKAITQDQANMLRQRIQDRERFFPNGPKNQYMEQALEKVLGIKSEELRSRIQAGETLEDILKKKGISSEDFKNKMIEAAKEIIQQAVKDGKITQTQADKMIEGIQTNPILGLDGPPDGRFGFGNGGRGGPGDGGLGLGNGNPGGPGGKGGPGGMRGKGSK